MQSTDLSLSETDIRSPRAQTWGVRSDKVDGRRWLDDLRICPLLRRFAMAHVGVIETPAPFEIVRTRLGGSYFLASLAGQGQVLVDGRWQRCRPGEAFLLPPGTLHAFRATPGKSWEFGWVRYRDEPQQRPVARANSRVVARFAGEPLRMALLGLYHECAADDTSLWVERWLELIHSYVQRFAEPRAVDERIWRLWEEVAEDLAHPWTSGELAHRAHLSEKQLERLCRRELGRTPRQQLIWLRMRHAARLLGEGGKIATIAAAVGYRNPFVFSTTFRRIMGRSPSAYPRGH